MEKTAIAYATAAIAYACAASGAEYAGKDLYSAEEHPGTVLELALASPLQLPPANWNVYGLRLGAIYSESFRVCGLDAGLVGLARDSFSGIQFQAVADWTEGDAAGIQLAGIANIVAGNATGGQLSAIVNYARGDFTGLQLASINHDGTFYGFQAGVFNYVKGISWGLQAGLANAAVNEWRGWSLGLCNYAERMYGLQLGAINIAAQSGRGVQFGLFNAADKFNGVQIGILNIIGRGEVPIMPILNANF